MKKTLHRDWSTEDRQVFSAASDKAVKYEGIRGDELAIADPADDFEGELIGVEFYPENSDEPARFLSPDWDTVDYLLERLLG
jgi:hypothetical protein